MPLAEIKMSEGAISANRMPEFAQRLTEMFTRYQGALPGSQAASSITTIEITEFGASYFFVSGQITAGPRVRVCFTVPEGSLDEDKKKGLVEETTSLVMEMQGREDPEPYDVWCMFNEVPDGSWAAAGKIFRWRDIVRWVLKRDIAARKSRDDDTKRRTAT